MSRALRKAVEVVKHKRDTELNLPDEGVANLEDVPELCKCGPHPLQQILRVRGLSSPLGFVNSTL